MSFVVLFFPLPSPSLPLSLAEYVSQTFFFKCLPMESSSFHLVRTVLNTVVKVYVFLKLVNNLISETNYY